VSNQTTAIDVKRGAGSVPALRAFLETPTVIAQVQKALPSSMRPDRLVRQAVTLAMQNPQLLQCSQVSIVLGILKSAELGLELSGPLGHAYLVPRKDKGEWVANLQVGWKGLVALAMRSGQIKAFPVRTVFSNDKFEIEYGTEQRLVHVPVVTGDKGAPVGYYAVVQYVNGGMDFEYMSRDDVLAHKAKYVKYPGPAWTTSEEAMCQKTVVRQLTRRLSLCPEAQRQAMEEEYEERNVKVAPSVEVIDAAAHVIDQAAEQLPAPETEEPQE
jgi:recombination protein RecT